MALQTPIEYEQASATVKAVYDDIMATRKTDWVNNFWKVLAHHPETLQRIWGNIKQVMGNGTLDPLTKELIYVAVSITNSQLAAGQETTAFVIVRTPTSGGQP